MCPATVDGQVGLGSCYPKGQRGNGTHSDNPNANQKDVRLISKTIARETIEDMSTREILVCDKPLK